MKRKKKIYKLKGYEHPQRGMTQAINNNESCSSVEPAMFGGIQAALPWSQGMLFWPTLDDARETDEYDRQSVMRAARYLFKNSGVIRYAVRCMWLLQGGLRPLPMTQDREWNRLALAAFTARTKNKKTIDVFGKLSWLTMQSWAEKKTSIDGDCLCVLARAKDGGAAVAWYSAPKICSPENAGPEWNQGVKYNNQGRPVAYGLKKDENNIIEIPAASAILYHHEPDPAVPRGESALLHAIRHGVDIAEIHGFTKASVKLSSAVGLVETKPETDKSPGMGSALGDKKSTIAADKQSQSFEIVTGGGARVVSLAPGRDIKAIYDQRPSPNVAAFIKDLLAEIAYGVGLDAEVLYNINALGSAAVRLVLEKIDRWVEDRRPVREDWANTVYRHIIACEMEAGRLRKCRAETWENVEWIAPPKLTIDVARIGALQINLIREGLADADTWTLATQGMTFEKVLERRAYNIARAHEISEEYGVQMDEIFPGAIGATHQPHETDSGVPPEDESPESTGFSEDS